ncbi:MAG: FtsX-like permease family protein [Candidatus Lokiarchaeota archaeon]|nr:FtsX-like permease family protein [Candidatus Lokiarchaeota archaeon]MBD3200338.1 FtsX-like permease family protein [Candidatus Lokiarchaeota archaeon]
MSLDFAIKDFYRKKRQTLPYLITIILVIALAEFMIYFFNSLDQNSFLIGNQGYANNYYFTGAISRTISQYNIFLLITTFILAFVLVSITTTTLVISKKRDISIMRALGTLPEKLYSFYLSEAFLIYFIGFFIGWFLGISIFFILSLIFNSIGIPIIFQFEIFYSVILFLICLAGVFLISGWSLRKIGNKKVIRTLSHDIPFDYDTSKNFKLIPKWLTRLGYNVKISVINTIRKKGKFRRYILIFTFISLILFTIGFSALTVYSSAESWVKDSQGDNIYAIAHDDVLEEYTDMYEMFSNPNLLVDQNDINFTDSKYLFNLTQIAELANYSEIEKIDERLIRFCDSKELQGIIIAGEGNYIVVGQERVGSFPVVGFDVNDSIQDFVIEGKFFSESDAIFNITIGDGLAYNFFDYPLNQKLELTSFSRQFSISGIVIDTFYSGYASYMDIGVFRTILNMSYNEINVILVKISPENFNKIEDNLTSLISTTLGAEFNIRSLNPSFTKNIEFVGYLNLFPITIIFIIGLVTFYSFYNFQKGDLMEKLKDFIIMRAIGSKKTNIRKILFLEGTFVLIPSLLIGLIGGMLFNSVFLIDRVSLPPLYVPFLILAVIFVVFMIWNFLSLIPIMKKINQFSLADIKIF